MKTILIIEEDTTVLTGYSNLLVGEEYNTISTLNAQEAFKKLKISKIDLILANLSSLKMEEDIFLSSIKKFAKRLPVILLSKRWKIEKSYSHQEASNIHRVLCMPVKREDLLNAIYDVLSETANLNMEQKEFAGCYIDSMIEIGGSGVVYKGKLDNTPVAIKILQPVFMQEPHQLVRFQRESSIMLQLKHPNIIEIFKVGYEENMPFIVMSYFPGQTIQKLLQSQKFLPVEEAIQIVIEITKGMALTHQYGIIHRDIKPSNILYNRDKKWVKIIDFGIAKQIQDDQSITGKNQIVGTPEYMSPEQCQNQILDATSDIYSLGATFYQILTGELPFNRKNSVRIMMAHLQEPVIWPKDTEKNIPVVLKNIVEKMLSKKRENRYPNMDILRKELENISS